MLLLPIAALLLLLAAPALLLCPGVSVAAVDDGGWGACGMLLCVVVSSSV